MSNPTNEIAAKPKVNWLKLVAILAATAVGFMLLPEKWQFLLAASVVIAGLLIPSGFIRSQDPLNTSYNVVRVALGLIILWGAIAPQGLLYYHDIGYRYAVNQHWPWFKPPTLEEENRPFYETLGQTPLYALFDSTSDPDSLITTLSAETVVQVAIETAKKTVLGDEFVRVIYTAGENRLDGWVKSNFLKRVGPRDWEKYLAGFTPPPTPAAVQASHQVRFPSTIAAINVMDYTSASGWDYVPRGSNRPGQPGQNENEVWYSGKGETSYIFSLKEVPTTPLKVKFIASAEYNFVVAPSDEFKSDVEVLINNRYLASFSAIADNGFGQRVEIVIPSAQLQAGDNQLTFKVGTGRKNGLVLYKRLPLTFST